VRAGSRDYVIRSTSTRPGAATIAKFVRIDIALQRLDRAVQLARASRVSPKIGIPD
jgi:hypothetical protein